MQHNQRPDQADANKKRPCRKERYKRRNQQQWRKKGREAVEPLEKIQTEHTASMAGFNQQH